jgi:hypothetical protein
LAAPPGRVIGYTGKPVTIEIAQRTDDLQIALPQ